MEPTVDQKRPKQASKTRLENDIEKLTKNDAKWSGHRAGSMPGHEGATTWIPMWRRRSCRSHGGRTVGYVRDTAAGLRQARDGYIFVEVPLVTPALCTAIWVPGQVSDAAVSPSTVANHESSLERVCALQNGLNLRTVSAL